MKNKSLNGKIELYLLYLRFIHFYVIPSRLLKDSLFLNKSNKVSLKRTEIAISLITDALLISLSVIIAYVLEKIIGYFLSKSSLDILVISILQSISSITTIISFTIFAIVDIIKIVIRGIIEIKSTINDLRK